MENPIFIHIPKTGGTTLNAAMEGTYWQTEPGFHYRHILPNKYSNSGDIFEPISNDTFMNYPIIMMVRHPVDRLLSEYYFIKERKEFTDLLYPRVSDIESYIRQPQTQNYTIGFLKGKRMYDTSVVTNQDLQDVKDSIEKLNIHVGIFEKFSDSMAYFSRETGINWSDTVEKKRVTFRRPNIEDVPVEIVKLIEENNVLDLELYNFCLNRFTKMAKSIKGEYTFKGDKYDHVLAFARRACFFEFCMNEKAFIKQNLVFFKELTFYMLNHLKISDGRQFTTLWNQVFLLAFNDCFPNNELVEKVNNLESFENDPIEHSFQIGNTIDLYFKENFSKCYRFKGMVFKNEYFNHLQ